MSSIIRFNIVDPNTIDIIFNKVNLIGLDLTNLPASFANRTTTAAARYSLSVTPGFSDLTPTYISDSIPTTNIFNDDFINLTNPRQITYKDRLYQRDKLVPDERIPIANVNTTPIVMDENIK
jgi:hypothetical protein